MDFDYVAMPAILLLVGILIVWRSVRRILSLSTKSYCTWRKVTEYIVLFFIVLLATAVTGSSAYNAIVLYRFRAHNPPPGAFYTVNGHRMHVNCTGSGSPTIVLEAGGGNDALIWGGVQPVLSKTTRVCSYDRAGYGWSDAVSAPRDADHVAAELHELLIAAKIDGPIVLMGHSIAEMYVRDYATRYPENIAGIIFVDGSTPLLDENPAMKAMMAKEPPWWVSMLLMRANYIAGLPRIMGQCSQPIPGLAGQAGKLEAEDLCHMQFGAMATEPDDFNKSGHETVHTGPYDVLPILIFSRDPAKILSNKNSPRQMVDAENVWSQMQEDLKKLSTRSRRIIAKGSGHYVQLFRADLIEKEVPLFIEQIRGTVPQPKNYGSTITE